MALLTCPECGHVVSDKAEKCPECGCPVAAMISPSPAPNEPVEDVAVPLPTAQNPLPNSADYSPKAEGVETIPMPEVVNPEGTHDTQPTETSSKKKIPIIVSAIALTAVVAIIVAVVMLKTTSGIHVDDAVFTQWRTVDVDDYSTDYTASLSSDTKKPFVAMIGYYDSDSINDLVYMNDGEGTWETTDFYVDEDDAKDPSTEYKPVGYLSGKTVDSSSFKSITYNESDYNDYSSLDSTSCSVDIDFEYSSKSDGILLYDVYIEDTNLTEHNRSLVLVDGKGTGSLYLSDLEYKSRGISLTITPTFFIPAKSISESDYTVTEEVTYEKDSASSYTSYSGEGEWTFDGFEDGFILYTRTLTEGGEREERGITENCRTTLQNNIAEIYTYDSSWDDDHASLQEPVYEFKAIGYIEYNLFTEENHDGE